MGRDDQLAFCSLSLPFCFVSLWELGTPAKFLLLYSILFEMQRYRKTAGRVYSSLDLVPNPTVAVGGTR